MTVVGARTAYLLLLLLQAALPGEPAVGRGRLEEAQGFSHRLHPPQLPQRFGGYLHAVRGPPDQQHQRLNTGNSTINTTNTTHAKARGGGGNG